MKPKLVLRRHLAKFGEWGARIIQLGTRANGLIATLTIDVSGSGLKVTTLSVASAAGPIP